MAGEPSKIPTDPVEFKELLQKIKGKSAEASDFSGIKCGYFLASILRASALSNYDINKFAECTYKWVIYEGNRVRLNDIGTDTYYSGVSISAEDYRP